MRGKLLPRHQFDPNDRNIPAYAGKTYRHREGGILCVEHPRVCGENPPKLWRPGRTLGTSPRMRGKRAVSLSCCYQRRNIPAYAGKTPWSGGVFRFPREHPRVCGENYPINTQVTTITGTSPRMRGKQRSNTRGQAANRNIPAYAGKTSMATLYC